MPNIINQIKVLIQYRHLLWSLAIKDIKVKYRNPILGVLWTMITPLVTIFILKLVFSTIMKMEIKDYPFFIYLMTAIFPWVFFSSSINEAIESILNNRELIKKTYFPRQIIPVSVVLANLLNFIPAVIVMFLILFLYKIELTMMIFLLPVIILLQAIFTVGLALILSTLQVFVRDVKYILEIVMMVWFYLSPIFYSLTLVADMSTGFFTIYALNPFVGLFVLYRAAFLKGYLKTLPPSLDIFLLTGWVVAVCIFMFFLGFAIFRKYEARFSELV